MTTDQDHHNNRLAAGGICAVLANAALDPVFVVDSHGRPRNAMTVKLPFLDSRYRVTVERVPDDEPAAEGGAGR